MKQFSLFDLQLLIVSQSSRDLDVNSNAVAGLQKKLKISKGVGHSAPKGYIFLTDHYFYI
jgi:hypothetical protein